MSTEVSIWDFCQEVAQKVEEKYGLADTLTLCYNLVSGLSIDMGKGVEHAARIVAVVMM